MANSCLCTCPADMGKTLLFNTIIHFCQPGECKFNIHSLFSSVFFWALKKLKQQAEICCVKSSVDQRGTA